MLTCYSSSFFRAISRNKNPRLFYFPLFFRLVCLFQNGPFIPASFPLFLFRKQIIFEEFSNNTAHFGLKSMKITPFLMTDISIWTHEQTLYNIVVNLCIRISGKGFRSID